MSKSERIEKNHYDTLEVSRNASSQEIRKAFLKKIREYHPDRVQTMAKEIRDIAERRTKEITEAYQVLKDDENRRKYDDELRLKEEIVEKVSYDLSEETDDDILWDDRIKNNPESDFREDYDPSGRKSSPYREKHKNKGTDASYYPDEENIQWAGEREVPKNTEKYQPRKSGQSTLPCPKCRNYTYYIDVYNRFWCNWCREYVKPEMHHGSNRPMRGQTADSPGSYPSVHVPGTGEQNRSAFQKNPKRNENKNNEQNIECPHCGQTLVPGPGYCWECGVILNK